jgi:hypothetical protein
MVSILSFIILGPMPPGEVRNKNKCPQVSTEEMFKTARSVQTHLKTAYSVSAYALNAAYS